MIEGFKVDITADELREHLTSMALDHRLKADGYAEDVRRLRERGDAAQHTSNDPTYSLSESAQKHRKRAAFFAFLADHVITGEVYRLPERDLELLELFSRYG